MQFHIAVLFLAAIYSSSPGQAARILGLFPTPSISHQVVYRAVMEEFAKRGHEIVMLTPDPVHYKDKKFENITEIDVHKTSYDVLSNTFVPADMKKQFGHPRNAIPLTMNMLLDLVDVQLSVPEMKAILENKEEHFDLIFVEGILSINYVAGARFKAPVIGIYSISAMLPDFDAVENPSHPILYADTLSVHEGELDFWQRLDSVYTNLFQRYYNWKFSEQLDEVARKHYGADAPTVEEARKQISMLFLNAHPITAGVHPITEKVIAKDDSETGVIYLSFGSNVKSKDLPMSKINIFIEAFRELPYNVLWKFENDTLPGQPSNVFISKWLPQNDVLGHSNIKAFITQGGLQSFEEAISNRVPLIGIPFMADQDFNVKKMVNLGIGIGLDIDTLTKTSLKEAIFEVTDNNKYRSSITRLSNLLEDARETGLERAVWWSEYVIRHGGAEHLRAPSVPLYQYLMLDILALVVSIVLVTFLTVYKVVQFLQRPIFGATKLKKS